MEVYTLTKQQNGNTTSRYLLGTNHLAKYGEAPQEGGVTGYLKDQGVPGEAMQHYQTAVQNGGAILSVNIPSGNVDQAGAEQVLSKYGASNLNAY